MFFIFVCVQWLGLPRKHLPIFEGLGSFFTKSLNISGMDDLFLKRVLFEWLRDR